jgi:hypothetical protein
MATRMEKQECGAERLKRARRLLEERLKGEITELVRRRNNKVLAPGKGRYGGRLDSVSCGPDLWAITGCRLVATLAGRLLTKSGLKNVEVYEAADSADHPGGRWIAAGLLR